MISDCVEVSTKILIYILICVGRLTRKNEYLSVITYYSDLSKLLFTMSVFSSFEYKVYTTKKTKKWSSRHES